MSVKGLAPLMLALTVGGPASAEVKSVTANGFEARARPQSRLLPIASMPRLARSAAGGVPLTPSRATPPISASSCAPAAVFASA